MEGPSLLNSRQSCDRARHTLHIGRGAILYSPAAMLWIVAACAAATQNSEPMARGTFNNTLGRQSRGNFVDLVGPVDTAASFLVESSVASCDGGWWTVVGCCFLFFVLRCPRTPRLIRAYLQTVL